MGTPKTTDCLHPYQIEVMQPAGFQAITGDCKRSLQTMNYRPNEQFRMTSPSYSLLSRGASSDGELRSAASALTGLVNDTAKLPTIY
jgi:hypothetical protein